MVLKRLKTTAIDSHLPREKISPWSRFEQVTVRVGIGTDAGVLSATLSPLVFLIATFYSNVDNIANDISMFDIFI